VAAAWVAVNVGMAVVSLALAARALKPLRADAGGPPLSARAFFSWSFSQWLGPLAWPVVNQLDRVLIARSSASLAGVTLYAIPANFLQRLQIFPALIGGVLGPMMTELQGHSAEQDISRIYLKSVRLVLWVMLPGLIVLFAVMPQFLSLWLGGRFGDTSVWPARLLVIAQVFWLLGTVPGSVIFAKDKPWYLPAYAWGQALISVLAWKLLIGRWQLLGVAAGSLLAQAIPVIALLWALHARVLKITWVDFGRAIAAPLASGLLTLAFVFPLHASVTSWTKLVGLLMLAAAVFYVSTWAFMGEEDRGVFSRYLRHHCGSAIV
jgi:O-antigen/teichoic acid export membrane protein